MANYRIHEALMNELTKKVKRIQNKCDKQGLKVTFSEVGEEFEETKEHGIQRYVICEVEGTAKFEGWEFVASIDHTSNGNVIDKALSDVEVPKKYWTSDTYCEHCKTRRNRKNVYLVRNTSTGRFKQIGKNCLMEYTHGLSAESVALALQWKNIFAEAEKTDWTSSRGDCRRWFDTKELLTLACGIVRCYGYARSGETNSTSSRLDECITALKPWEWRRYYDSRRYAELYDFMNEHDISYDNKEDRKTAQDALKWLKKQKQDSDYMHNLKTVLLVDHVPAERFGLLVSLIPTYFKAVERELKMAEREKAMEEEKKISNFVGEVGKRITVEVAECRELTSWDTEWGTTHLYKFTDKDGNVFIWKSSVWLEPKNIERITGTVKEHAEFREVKQTTLTRCAVNK